MIYKLKDKWYHHHDDVLDVNCILHECPIRSININPNIRVGTRREIAKFNECSWNGESIVCTECRQQAPEEVNNFATMSECLELEEHQREKVYEEEQNRMIWELHTMWVNTTKTDLKT